MKNQNELEVEEVVPAKADQGFFFKLSADAGGLTELSYVQDGSKVMATLYLLLHEINSNFTEPCATVGEFARELGSMSDKIDEVANGKQSEVGPQNS